MEPMFYLYPKEAWDYHERNIRRLEDEMVEIASVDECTYDETKVYITDEDGALVYYVYQDDKKVFQSRCDTDIEAEENLREIYKKYIGDCNEDTDDPIYDLDIESVEIREAEIYDAFCTLVEELASDEDEASSFLHECDAEVDDMIDHIVEFLACSHGLRVFRPTEIEPGVIADYPYEV